MPDLTVRAFAEMIHLPGHAQVRILNEQKYPKQGPNVFKLPFYKPALDEIRGYYRNGNNLAHLRQWILLNAASLKPLPKQVNNIRVVSSFQKSPESKRTLLLKAGNSAFKANPNKSVELRLRFDIEASENGNEVYILYNCRNLPMDPDVAKDTVQLAFWVMQQTGFNVSIGQIEFVDLASSSTYKCARLSKRLVGMMSRNAQLVAAIWPTI